MSDNPYTPPEATVADQPPAPGSPIKAVALGMLTDIGGSIVVGGVLSIVYGIVLAQQGLTPEQAMDAIKNAPILSPFGLISTAMGLGFSFLGGYVCARIAKRSELRLGAVMAVLNTVLGLLLSGDQTSAPKLIVLVLLSIAAVMVGSWKGRVKNWHLAHPNYVG